MQAAHPGVFVGCGPPLLVLMLLMANYMSLSAERSMEKRLWLRQSPMLAGYLVPIPVSESVKAVWAASMPGAL